MTHASRQMIDSLITGSLKGFARSLQESRARLNKQQQFIIDAVRVDAIPPGIRQQMHYDVGRAAQLSVQQGYTHRRYRRGSTNYRTAPREDRNFRYAGGLLLRALQAPDFFVATPDTLRWGNINRLDQEAKQWRRLNFGAGGAAGETPRQFQMHWGTFVGAAIGLEPDPRPAFRIPPGYWFTEGAGERVRRGVRVPHGEFYPVGEQPAGRWGRPNKVRMTRGIAASNFLDAGVRRIAEEYPRAISTMITRLGQDKGRAQAIKLKHTITVPLSSGVQRFAPRR